MGTILLHSTIQAELNLMKKEELAKKYHRFFDFSEDLNGVEGRTYDQVYMFERTKMDPTKTDSMIQMKILMKFAQLDDGVLFTLDANIVDVYFLPNMVMQRVFTKIVQENAVNRDKSIELWPKGHNQRYEETINKKVVKEEPL